MELLKKLFLIIFVFALFFCVSPVKAEDYNYSVESITVSPDKPYEDIETTITIKLKNYSPSSLTDASEINNYILSIEDFSRTEITLPTVSANNPIDNNEEFTYTVKGSFTSVGTKEIFFKNAYSSNSKSLTAEVVPAEDLTVDSIAVSPAAPTVNENCQIKVKVKNSGQNNLDTGLGLYSYIFSFPDFVKTSVETPAVSWRETFDSGEYVYFTFEGKFTSIGEKTLEFLLDENDQLEENNENNNTNSAKVTVINKQELDLIVDEIIIENDYGLMDEQTEIVVKVKNNGEVSLVNGIGLGSDNIYLYSSNFSAGDIITDALPTVAEPLEPDEIFTYTFQGFFNKTGLSRIDVKLNNKNLLSESNTSNNATSTEVMVYLNQEKADEFTISNEKIEFKSSTEATISWETSKEANSVLTIKKVSIYSDIIKTSTVNDKTKFSVDVSELYPGLTYYYKIEAVNGLANSESEYIMFTAPADNTVHLSGNIDLNKDIDDVTIKWSTNLLSSGHVYYKLKTATEYTKAGSASLSVLHEVKLENLEGDYEYYVESISDDEIYKSVTNSFSIVPVINDTADTSSDSDNSENESTSTENSGSTNELKITIKNANLYNSLKGKIVLKVESNGEAYYVNPIDSEMSYLGRPDDAFSVMRSEGIGINNENLEKIQVGLSNLSGVDSDSDGLSDLFEDAIGTDKEKSDSDGDGYSDKVELEGNFNPNGTGALNLDSNFSVGQKGKIFLAVENNGEAWYINPGDSKRYFLGRPTDAFNVMRNLGLGISNANFESL